jgi:hypothetical protein
MALELIFSDSFDHYDIDRLGLKWDEVENFFIPGMHIVAGRNGHALQNGGLFNFARQNVDVPALESGSFCTVLVAFRLDPPAGAGNPYPVTPIVELDTASTVDGQKETLVSLSVSEDGTPTLTVRGSSAIRMTNALHLGIWYMVQIGVALTLLPTDPPSMSIDVKAVIDEPVGSESGGWTALNSGSLSSATGFALAVKAVSLPGNTLSWDDFAFFSDLAPLSFMLDDMMIKAYDQRVLMRLPTGDGADMDFVPGSGAGRPHYPEVDENPPDDDTTFNQSANFTDKDTYTYPAVPAIGTNGKILGVQNTLYARARSLSTPGPVSPADGITGFDAVSSILRVSGVDHISKDKHLRYDGYRFFAFPTTYNPDTDALFTLSELNAAEFGLDHASYYGLA